MTDCAALDLGVSLRHTVNCRISSFFNSMFCRSLIDDMSHDQFFRRSITFPSFMRVDSDEVSIGASQASTLLHS